MFYKLTTICMFLIMLAGCANNQQENPNRYHTALCAAIKERLNKKHPPQLQTRMLTTERAKLMKEYKEYHCGE